MGRYSVKNARSFSLHPRAESWISSNELKGGPSDLGKEILQKY